MTWNWVALKQLIAWRIDEFDPYILVLNAYFHAATYSTPFWSLVAHFASHLSLGLVPTTPPIGAPTQTSLRPWIDRVPFTLINLVRFFLPRVLFDIILSTRRFLGLAYSLAYVDGSAHVPPINRCHLGKSIIYDTVTELHWSADIRTHGIVVVIEQILSADWSERTGKSGNKKGWWGRRGQGHLEQPAQTRLIEGIDASFEDRVEVPAPKPDEDCVECYAWEFGDYMNGTIPK